MVFCYNSPKNEDKEKWNIENKQNNNNASKNLGVCVSTCVCVCICVFNVVSLRKSLSSIHAISYNYCCRFTEKADVTAASA